MAENLLGKIELNCSNNAKADFHQKGNTLITQVGKSYKSESVQLYCYINRKQQEKAFEVTFTSTGAGGNFKIAVNRHLDPNIIEYDIKKKGTYRFYFKIPFPYYDYRLCFYFGESAGQYEISDISIKSIDASKTIETLENISHIDEEGLEKIQELESMIQFYDEKLSALVGKSVRIVPECESYLNKNHERKVLGKNDVLRNMIFTVKDYQSGLYILSFPEKPDILVSFEMVTRV